MSQAKIDIGVGEKKPAIAGAVEQYAEGVPALLELITAEEFKMPRDLPESFVLICGGILQHHKEMKTRYVDTTQARGTICGVI